MSLPSSANLPQYPFPANARAFDFEFWRMAHQCMAYGEGIAPFNNAADCTITGMGTTKATDLECTTGSSGLNVSVALGNAWVQGDGRTTQGLYFCHVPTANTVTLEAAHATNPRIDQIVLKVEDADVSGANTQWSLTYVKGTATGGATLTNLTGAAALPSNCLLLAYVLVPATFAGPFVTATHILDVRFFAYRPGRVIGFLESASSDSAGSGDKLGPLTVVGNGVNKVSVEGYGHPGNLAAGVNAFLRVRDGAGGTGTAWANSGVTQPAAGYGSLQRPAGDITAFSGQKSLYLNLTAGAGTPTEYAGVFTSVRRLVARYK